MAGKIFKSCISTLEIGISLKCLLYIQSRQITKSDSAKLGSNLAVAEHVPYIIFLDLAKRRLAHKQCITNYT